MSADSKLVCVQDFEDYARSILPKNALDYYQSGSGEEYGLKLNRDAFRWMTDGATFSHEALQFTRPVILYQQTAGAEGAIFTLSTLSTSSIEEVAAAAPDTVKWFQLYIYKDRKVTMDLVQRAEKAGFKAIVLTVDAPVFGIRLADLRNKFVLPSHLRLANFDGHLSTNVNDTTSGSSINDYVANLFDQSVTWEDVKWLKRSTNLPIVLKGILTEEDAKIAADLGVQGIQVSNHGARQIDGTLAPMEALPAVARAVGGRCEVFLDGGVRQGGDVFKALAGGARAVFAGRPLLWGLAAAGEAGARQVLRILRRELDHTLALAGCTKISDIRPCMIGYGSPLQKL
ncbi:Hydroxyacid oxidase 1-like Protein [Gryllus bimaculatus]|nr:Hydroxyacid oxidase 1-like Protein [Gryllus bimaculatus]